jgi:hypothetical protein
MISCFVSGQVVWGYDVVPPGQPIWAPPQEAAACTEEQSKNFQTLSAWCDEITAKVSARLKQRTEWDPSFRGTSVTFLVSNKGEIEDLFILFGKDEAKESLAISEISLSAPLPPPPQFFGGRRLRIDLNYPKIRVLVDDHWNEQDKELSKKYFDYVRSNHPK